MNDVIINVNTKTGQADKLNSLQKIGNQHQNLQNKLKFEMSEMIEGVAWLEYEIDEIKKYALMEQYEKGYQIDIKSCLLISNHVSVDIKITQEENPNGIPIFVSSIVKYAVAETINAEEEEPEEYPTWQESLSSKLAEFENAEKERNDNETTRITSENERISNENQRKEQETNRETNEVTRQSNEGKRDSSEITRNKNEEIRITNENVRIENENARINSENIRNESETKREQYIEDLKSRVEAGEFNGECNFATFDVVHGKLIMRKTENMLLDFKLDGNRLKVVI